jgi:hypothetical protein
MPKAIDPDMPFFRHIRGNGAARPGQQFGHDLLYKWWKRACAGLGIEGVDLYGGTRHSTVIYLREKGFSPEEVKRSSSAVGNRVGKIYTKRKRVNDLTITP